MPTPDYKRPSSDSGMGSWYSMAGAGVEFVVAVLMFAGVGWLLDRWLATAPWLLIAGVAVGFGTGLYILLRMAQRTFRD
ncbi:MAG: AtpZ/AtpI family protein [Phycisphaeraceae bacterium]|nr:AtpZ/AtpI family protein [Phycisphaeraceae bacterium]